MKLAKASQNEITTLCRWLQAKDAAKFENAKDRPPAFMRVLFGYETLVNNCCDPNADTLEWKPGYAPADTDRLRAALEEIEREASGALNNAHPDEAPDVLANVKGIATRALCPNVEISHARERKGTT
jgi:hypothetical protein